MSRTRRHFTDEFELSAQRRGCVTSSVRPSRGIARDLGVGDNPLRRWVGLMRDGAMGMDASKPLRTEALSAVQRLQRELKRVPMERDILKMRSATSRRARSEVRVGWLQTPC
ncbi:MULTISPECIES: transposase [unclassified Burkholderia]|uniref:transposase n=1 Tax=Burkholderia sp. MSMB1552 TaxID=1636424 RepID=UPI0009E77DE7